MALARLTASWGMTRWQPERELQRLRAEMDRLFREACRDGSESDWRVGAWAPPVGLYEADDAFVLKAELPGLSKGDVHLRLDASLQETTQQMRASDIGAGTASWVSSPHATS